MQDANAAGWSGGSPLPADVLGSLHELNHRFLALRAAHAERVGGLFEADPAALHADATGMLSPEQRLALARCPYALFDLRFQDEAHWCSSLRDAAAWRVADQPDIDGDSAHFVHLALFFAWYLASTNDLAAQLVLGMGEPTAAALRRITVDRLPALAAAEAPHLTARWSHCTVYWTTLVHAASRSDPALLRRTQLFGLQLAAGARLQWSEPGRRAACAAASNALRQEPRTV